MLKIGTKYKNNHNNFFHFNVINSQSTVGEIVYKLIQNNCLLSVLTILNWSIKLGIGAQINQLSADPLYQLFWDQNLSDKE